MTLETADLLAIAGIVFGSMLAVVGGALAWLRADIAKLDQCQRATGTKVGSLTQELRTNALARNPLTTRPESGCPAAESDTSAIGTPHRRLRRSAASTTRHDTARSE